MNWINALENPPLLEEMLVVCKECGHVHAVIYDYDEYSLPERCGRHGPYGAGKTIHFDLYMPLPKPPPKEAP